MTQFKDKSAKQGEGAASVGLFTYPILQAADILLYRPHFVPVGEDQRQHLELTRDLAQRFNSRYKRTFRLPEPYILKSTAKIYDLQLVDKQMSKSLGGSGMPRGCSTSRRSARSGSGRPSPTRARRSGSTSTRSPASATCSRSTRRSAASRSAALEEQYAGRGYGDLKGDVAELVVSFVTPFRDRTLELLDDQAYLTAVLQQGAETAGAVAEATLRDVYQRVGFVAPRRGPAGA